MEENQVEIGRRVVFGWKNTEHKQFTQGSQHKIIYAHRIHDFSSVDDVNGRFRMIHMGINSQKSVVYCLEYRNERPFWYLLFLLLVAVVASDVGAEEEWPNYGCRVR